MPSPTIEQRLAHIEDKIDLLAGQFAQLVLQVQTLLVLLSDTQAAVINAQSQE